VASHISDCVFSGRVGVVHTWHCIRDNHGDWIGRDRCLRDTLLAGNDRTCERLVWDHRRSPFDVGIAAQHQKVADRQRTRRQIQFEWLAESKEGSTRRIKQMKLTVPVRGLLFFIYSFVEAKHANFFDAMFVPSRLNIRGFSHKPRL